MISEKRKKTTYQSEIPTIKIPICNTWDRNLQVYQKSNIGTRKTTNSTKIIGRNFWKLELAKGEEIF